MVLGSNADGCPKKSSERSWHRGGDASLSSNVENGSARRRQRISLPTDRKTGFESLARQTTASDCALSGTCSCDFGDSSCGVHLGAVPSRRLLSKSSEGRGEITSDISILNLSGEPWSSSQRLLLLLASWKIALADAIRAAITSSLSAPRLTILSATHTSRGW